ncbi:MAG TPA: hydroxyacid dehydrogenase, partial [Clostridium sp.]
QYMRISNTLIAVMNSKDPSLGSSTINMKYNEKEDRLKIMLWGKMKFTEEMLSTVSILTETDNL